MIEFRRAGTDTSIIIIVIKLFKFSKRKEALVCSVFAWQDKMIEWSGRAFMDGNLINYETD